MLESAEHALANYDHMKQARSHLRNFVVAQILEDQTVARESHISVKTDKEEELLKKPAWYLKRQFVDALSQSRLLELRQRVEGIEACEERWLTYGDSLTEGQVGPIKGVHSSPYTATLQEKMGVVVTKDINEQTSMAVPGATTKDLCDPDGAFGPVMNMIQRPGWLKPSLVLIMAGTNDMGRLERVAQETESVVVGDSKEIFIKPRLEAEISETVQNIQSMHARIHDQGVPTIILGIPSQQQQLKLEKGVCGN